MFHGYMAIFVVIRVIFGETKNILRKICEFLYFYARIGNKFEFWYFICRKELDKTI